MSLADRIILTSAIAVISAAVIVGQFDLVPRGALCWSVILLGRECAGCGLTRSFAAIGRGDIDSAFAFNPIGPILFGAIVLLALIRLAKVADPRFRYWFEADVAIGAFVAMVMAVRLIEFYFF